jgi:hypothetical protein
MGTKFCWDPLSAHRGGGSSDLVGFGLHAEFAKSDWIREMAAGFWLHAELAEARRGKALCLLGKILRAKYSVHKT